jgi:threonine/homoserine/homoserine lactone efflux protein
MMLSFLLQGLALGFAAAVQPGPFMAYLISQTLAHGFKRTWIAAFAPLLSDGPIIALSLLVLSQLPGWLQRGLNIAGGLFILYLAWGAFWQWRTFSGLAKTPAIVASQSLARAAFMNALSPFPYIYWSLVTGPILLAGWRSSPLNGISFLVAFYSIMISGFLALMALFSVARQFGARASRILLGISALALAGFGLFQLARGILQIGG